ncbi:MAG TPA: hypothetical protein VF263_04005 [Longimicrobiaceae bacterium]
MLEIIGLAATGIATVGGYVQSRKYVSRRLRFVEAVQRPAAAVMVGAAAAVAAAPVVALLPVVGAGTALLFGAGVWAGVAAGARSIRRGDLPPA